MEWPAAAIFLWRLPRRLLPKAPHVEGTSGSPSLERQRSERHLNTTGDLIIVEGTVIRVDRAGWGKSRRGRYVIHTADAVVVYEGPRLLAGRRELVRFTATIQSHSYSESGQLETVVDNARDAVVIR